MAHAVFVALALQRLRLVTEPVIHKHADVVDQITLDLTDKGWECLAEC